MIDQFYTPPALAALLVGAARVKAPNRIADFAMGDGALLRAAETRWPHADLYGSDIDPTVSKAATGLGSRFHFNARDFLAEAPEPGEIGHLKKGCDLILLNPPFTCKGNKRHAVKVGDETAAGSKALAFVARALEYLKPGGEILAIVPASCVTSQRDRALLGAMRKSFTVEQIGEINRKGFDGCSVAVIVMRISHSKPTRRQSRAVASPKLVMLKPYALKIMRGTVAIHRTTASAGGMRVLHTVDLRSKCDAPERWTKEPRRIVSGPVMLLPRVGRPDVTKFVEMNLPTIALSDCVIAIKCEPAGHEQEVFRLLRSNWTAIEQLYGGSCAPYITLDQLQTYLLSLGIQSETVSDMQSEAGSLQHRALECDELLVG